MNQGRRGKTGEWISLVWMSLVLGYTVLFAAVPISQARLDAVIQQRIAVLLAGAAGLFYWLLALRRRGSGTKTGKWIWPMSFVLVYGLFQVVPLPLGLIRIVSPARAALADALPPVLPKPTWTPISVIPSTTLENVLLLAACAVIFLVIYSICSRLAARPFAASVPLMILAAGEGVLGVVQVSQQSIEGTVAVGTFAVRNHYSGFLEMILPLAVAYPLALLTRKNPRGRDMPLGAILLACAGFACAALILVGILDSVSRMGFLACILGLVVVALVGYGRGRTLRQNLTAIALVAAATVLAVVTLASSTLVTRFSKTDNIDRPAVWRDTTRLIAAYPVFGCGLGGFQSAFVKYKNSNPTLEQDYGHNDYLQYLSELGLIGFAAGLWAILLILAPLKQAWSQPYRPDVAWLAIGCAGSAAAIAFHSFADFNLYVPANMFLFAWILGMSAATKQLAREGGAY